MKPIHKKYLTTVSLIWSALAVLFIIAYLLLLAPQRKTKKQIEQQLAEKEKIYNSAREMAQEETKIKLNEQIKSLQNTLKDFVIDFEDSANLTFDISQIANEKNVDSLSIKTRDKQKRRTATESNLEYIQENQTDISFTASFNQFAALLNALERHRRPVIFVDNFSIMHSRKNITGNEAAMNISFFVKKRQDG